MRLQNLIPLISILLLYALSIAMIFTISQYLSFESNIGFLKYKQSLIHNKFWLTVFYIHVFTCFICLFAGLTQFSKKVLQNYPCVHRAFGKIYFYTIVVVNFPAGFILAIYANGGLPGKLAFLTLAILWAYFTISSVFYIKKGNIVKHREQMIRSYSLTLTALTLRLLKSLLSNYSNWTYDQIYIFDAWTALILNLMAAELIIYFVFNKKRNVLETLR